VTTLKTEIAKLRKEVDRLSSLISRSHYEKPLIDEWNYYRQIYPSLTFREKKLLHEFWYRRYGKQRGYAGDLRFFLRCIEKTIKKLDRRLKIAEYGGRDGGLAREIMKKHPATCWVNYEIIPHQPVPGLEKHDYVEHVLEKELWLEKPDMAGFDVFASCNTLEHISSNQLYALFNYVYSQRVPYLLLRVSTSPRGEDWKDYNGSHVLRAGTNEVKKLLRKRGYRLVEEENYERDLSFLRGWCSFWVLKD